jgi:hypothetical protein
MRIGDQVVWKGRLCVVRGIDPMGISGRVAYLEVVETGEELSVPVEQIEEEPEISKRARHGNRRR